VLFSDVQGLNLQAAKLETPLAMALAKAEIADAAWTLEPDWARRLLREAYELTLPTDEEIARRRDNPAGASAPDAGEDRAKGSVRSRVLQVAAHDPALAKELAESGIKKLGEGQQTQGGYRALTTQALQRGDTAAAGQYIEQSIKADPTQLDPGFSIMQLAGRDRAAADNLIIEYIDALRAVPLSGVGAARAYVMLSHLVFPASTPPMEGLPQHLPPPGPAVMRAYVSFMIDSLMQLEQSEPGSLQRFRPMLMNVWPILRQYAPDLAGAFYQAEALSRRPGEDASLPKGDIESVYKERYEKRVKDELDSDKPDLLTIYSAINREDFEHARRMIDKLDEGPQKAQLTEAVSAKEALSLASKGDSAGAARLASQLKKATSMLNVYPAIIEKCVAKKDRACATNLTYQAVKQLKDADATPPAPPAGVPASFLPTGKEFDPVLATLNKLAKAIAPVNEPLALEVLDEIVQAANRSELDTRRGLTGLETDVFIKLAVNNDLRVRQAATELKDPLRQIVALAAVDRWKAEQLTKSAKANKNPS
jgi:hypothetical protein